MARLYANQTNPIYGGEETEAPQAEQLTAEITDDLGRLGSQADEVLSRLWALKERLFGPEVTNAAGSGPPEPKLSDVNSFAGVARGSLRSLRRTLNSIDGLSHEIASRL